MNKPTPTKAFNEACAKYMDYEVAEDWVVKENGGITVRGMCENNYPWEYNPHDNMNQLLPVVDKIVKNETFNYSLFPRIMTFYRIGAEQALINFVTQALNITEATNES